MESSDQVNQQLKKFIEKQIGMMSEEFVVKNTADLSIPDNVVEESLQKLNASLKKESQLTFSRQSQRKLLEDIHRAQQKKAPGPTLDMSSPALQSDSFLEIFPNVWPNHEEDPALADQYNDAHKRIRNLQKSLAQLRKTTEGYAKYREVLEMLPVSELTDTLASKNSQCKRKLDEINGTAKEVGQTLQEKRPALTKRFKEQGSAKDKEGGESVGVTGKDILSKFFSESDQVLETE